jgi:hypothetical protein
MSLHNHSVTCQFILTVSSVTSYSVSRVISNSRCHVSLHTISVSCDFILTVSRVTSYSVSRVTSYSQCHVLLHTHSVTCHFILSVTCHFILSVTCHFILGVTCHFILTVSRVTSYSVSRVTSYSVSRVISYSRCHVSLHTHSVTCHFILTVSRVTSYSYHSWSETSGPLVCSHRLAILSQINTVCVYFFKAHFNTTPPPLYLVSRDSLVVQRQDRARRSTVPTPGGATLFIHSKPSRPALGSPTLLGNGCRGYFPRIKRPKREDHSPSTTGVKNGQSYSTAPSHAHATSPNSPTSPPCCSYTHFIPNVTDQWNECLLRIR